MNAAARGLCVLSAAALAACTLPRSAPQPTAPGPTLSPEQLLVAVQQDTARLDEARDATQRAQLLAAATGSAQQCLAQAADNAACQYAQAQVLGLTAQERPLQAAALLK